MSTFHNKRPFTLIEILVTMGIIAVLAGISVGAFKYVSRHNQETVTRTTLKQIEVGLEAVNSRFGYYPPKDTAGDFVLPSKDGDTWALFTNAPPVAYTKLFKRSVDLERLYQRVTDTNKPVDAWGRPFRYQCPGTVNKTSFDLVSGGPDGDPGTEEDNIANYELGN